MNHAPTLTLLGLGAIGLVLAVYMTRIFVRVQRGEAVRCFDGSCPIVMKTSDARTLGFPNYFLAIPFYALVTVFAALRLAGLVAWLFVPVVAASALSLAMSVYLAFALIVKLKQP